MNKTFLITMLLSLLLVLINFQQASAQESTEEASETIAPAVIEESAAKPDSEDVIIPESQDVEMQDPGMLPDHPFYFLKRWKEGLGNLFTIRVEKRAERLARLSEKRLAEAQKMAEKGRNDLAEKIMNRYENTLAWSEKKMEIAEKRGKNVSKIKMILENNFSRRIEVLEKVKSQVSPKAQEKIERVIENMKEKNVQKMEKLENRIEEKVNKKKQRAQDWNENESDDQEDGQEQDVSE